MSDSEGSEVVSQDANVKKKVITGRFLFVERMKREGREKEWFATLKKIQNDTGLRFSQAASEAMKQMGYINKEDEEVREHFRLANVQHTAEEQAEILATQEAEAVVLAQSYEDALGTLPDTAPAAVEIEWIRSHPAMSRATRSTQKTKDILLTVEDVLTIHGRAPSKSAVHQLQHWCNKPTEFFKQLLTEQKKQTEAAGHSGERVGSDDTSEVEDMLKEFRRGNEVYAEKDGDGRSQSPPDVLPASSAADAVERLGEFGDRGDVRI